MAEDCLNLDVTMPNGVNSNSKLPVMVWIYGGGFLEGDVGLYKPMFAINYAQQKGLPFIHVAMNYRLNLFGFLCGKEMAQSGVCNLGLRDQRLALKWVKKYISYFGGDPDKVTIYGESAGGISVALHLTAFGAQKETNLFRAGISESGSSNSLVLPSYTFFQQVYDTVVSKVGCNKTSNTLECLKRVPYATLTNIVKSYPAFGILRVPWGPTIDGDYLPDAPFRLLKQGKFVKVPYIIGDNLDEGTGFVKPINWVNDQLVKDAIKGTWTNLTQPTLDKLMSLYPNIPSQGSPYNTGDRTYYGAEGKRVASIYGDLCFSTPRRYLIEQLSAANVPVWTYRFDFNWGWENVNNPGYVGIAHTYEIFAVYYALPNVVSNAMAAYWPAFATGLDPNTKLKGFVKWTSWDKNNLAQIRFEQNQVVMKQDNDRKEASDFVNSNLEEFLGWPTPPPHPSF
eukprot:TRINITY_DN4637_c0_g2_i2.p1 TRINITY_DN4637_c0_g2~~TRINITY_DN4637_c0_g2_i2.p1  ORF type:complete len:453 (-),score=112.68 TRINITY_DN4637_c0_g2_i2:87-1445(-)